MFGLQLRGAKVKGVINVENRVLTAARFSAVWDSDGYFQPAESNEVLVIPSPRRAGRYQIRVAVRWMNPWEGIYGQPPYPPMEELTNSLYYTCVRINDQLQGNDARATANAVRAAAGTTQYFAVDANLDAGDRVGIGLGHDFGTDIQATVFLEIRRLGRKVHEVGDLAGAAEVDSAGPEPFDEPEAVDR
jgi:hypothetical protein